MKKKSNFTKLPVRLSHGENATLVQIFQNPKSNPKIILHAKIIQALANGHKICDIAKEFNLHESNIFYWRNRFLKERISALKNYRNNALVLSTEEYEFLQNILQKKTKSKPRAIVQAKIILALAKDIPINKVAEENGVTSQTVIKWRDRFLKDSLKSFKDIRKNRPSFLNTEEINHLQMLILNPESNPKDILRAKIILALDKEIDQYEIAHQIGINWQTVNIWRRRLQNDRHTAIYGHPPIIKLSLNAEEQKYLQNLINGSKGSPEIIFRAQIILALAKGLNIAKICKNLNTCWTTVDKWLKRFKKDRLNGLQNKPRQSNMPLILNDEERQYLKIRINNNSKSKMKVIPAKIILNLNSGVYPSKISRELNVSRQTVYKWRDHFLKDRLKEIKKNELILNAEEIKYLQNILNESKSQIKYAQVILALAAGISPNEISSKYGIFLSTIYYWRKRFKKKRLKILKEYGKNDLPINIPFKLSDNEEKCLLDLVHNKESKPEIIIRAKIIMAFAKGVSKQKICTEYETSWPTINKWSNRFKAERMKIFRVQTYLELSAEEQKYFQDLILNSESREEITQAKVILDLVSANKPVKIARKYDIPRHTVYAWLTRFKKNRLKVFQYQIPIVLTNEEQKFLQDLILNTASKPTIILRARILLALAQGISSNLICSKYGTSWRTINKWGNRFRKERLKGLQDDKRCKPLATFYPTIQ